MSQSQEFMNKVKLATKPPILEKKYHRMKCHKVNIFSLTNLNKDIKVQENIKRSISYDGNVWLDLVCAKDKDKIITAWVKSIKIALAFYNLERNNSIEFLKTSLIWIVAQWYMGLKQDNKTKILYGENPNENEMQELIVNRYENEIIIEFLREDWESGF